MVRQWLGQDAERVAALVCWGVYTERDALEELRGLGRLADIRCKRLDCSTDAVARDMLEEELHRQGRAHRDTEKAISSAALAVLLDGGNLDEAAKASALVARVARLPPPPAIVTSAMEYVRFRMHQGRRRVA